MPNAESGFRAANPAFCATRGDGRFERMGR